MTPSSKLTFAPLYEQVKKAILNRIIAGEWGPGSFLPSEIALAKEYGVSQGTLRKALNALTREKRLVRYQGKGTAVAVLDEDSSLFPFFLLSDRNGKRVYPLSQIYGVRLATPSDAERAALELAPDAKVIHIDRVRMLNDFPVINERVALPTARFPHFNFEFDKVPNTLYEHYQIHFGITVAHATEQIEVTMPDSGDLKRLNIERNHPLLLVTRTSFDLQDRPVEFRISRINTGNHVYAPTCAERAPSVPEPPKRGFGDSLD